MAAPTKLKPKREPDRRQFHTRRIHNASRGGPTKLKLKQESVEGGCTSAAFTMQAVAAPTKLKTKRESSRRRSHTRRSDNASGCGNKIETHTRISPKTVAHAPHSQCKRWARTKLKLKRESARRRSHTQRIHNERGLPSCLRAS